MRTNRLRPVAALLVVVVLCTASLGQAAAPAGDAAAQISLYVNGRLVEADVAPELRDGRVYVPLRAVATALGAQVSWNPDRQEAAVTRGGTELKLTVGRREAVLNGRPYVADAAPAISGGRTLVPLRMAAEALGAAVAWEAGTRSVRISLPGQSAAAAKPLTATALTSKAEGSPATPSWASDVPNPLPAPPGAPPGPPAPPAPAPPRVLDLVQRALQNFQAMYPGMHVGEWVTKFHYDIRTFTNDPTKPFYAPLVCYSGPKPASVNILFGSRFGIVMDAFNNPVNAEAPPYSTTLAFTNEPGYLPVPDHLKESWSLTPEELKAGVNPRTHPSYRPGLPIDAKGQQLPTGCNLLRNDDQGVLDRPILDAVITPLPYDIDATIQADTAAWEPGKPARIYLRVNPRPERLVCIQNIKVTVPDWFGVVEAQGAEIKPDTWSTTVSADDAVLGPRAPTLSANPHQTSMPVLNLTWKTRLLPGKPFERWIDVLPGTPPPGSKIESVGVILWGITTYQDPKEPISRWKQSRGVWNKQVHLPLGARSAPGKARLSAAVSRITVGINQIDFSLDPGTLDLLDKKIAVWAAGESGNLTPINVTTENGKPVNTLWPNPIYSKQFKMVVRTPTGWGTSGFLLPAGTTKIVAEVRGNTVAGWYHSEERLEIPLADDTPSVEAQLTLRPDNEPKPSQLPPVRQPTDNVEPGDCLTGLSQPDSAFITINVQPPFLSEQRQFQARVEAALVGDSAGRLPLTLHASAPGELTDVTASGNRMTATLTATGLERLVTGSYVDLTALADDGTTAFVLVPVGGDAVLEGRAIHVSGNWQEVSPVSPAKVRVEASWDTLRYVPEVYTDRRGYYSAAVEADRAMTISIDHAEYLPATFTMPPTAPDDQGVIQAPQVVYMLKQETLANVRRRLALSRKFHDDARKGGPLLAQAGVTAGGTQPAEVPDPTVPEGQMSKYLDRVEAGTEARPRHAQEALRRLDLALELETFATPEARRLAGKVVSEVWDGGLGLLSQLWSAADKAWQLNNKLKVMAVGARRGADLQAMSTALANEQGIIEQAMFLLLGDALGEGKTPQQTEGNIKKGRDLANKLVPWLVGKLREESARRWDTEVAPQVDQALGGVGLQRGSAAETAIMNYLKGGPMEVFKVELQGLLTAYVASGYLDMVNAELTGLTQRAQAGQFSAGGMEVATEQVHREIRDLQAMASLSTEPWEIEALASFAEGVIKDYQGWGQAALILVTEGAAAPVLAATVDRAIPLVQGLIAGRRFKHAVEVYLKVLYPDSDWWLAVQKGIRDAFDARAVSITGP